MNRNIFYGFLMAFMLFSGCGSSDKRTNSEVEDNNSLENALNSSFEPKKIKTGLVLDSHIIGLRYVSTSTNGEVKKGITNSKGEFEYFENGKTEFYIGSIKIGETTPNKLVAITSVANTKEEQSNIARFLQTVDSDLNPDNGIQISKEIDNNANNLDLKFDKNFISNFESIQNSLFGGNKTLVSEEVAMEHASKSVRLSALQEFDLYKVIANEKNYRGGDGYYNADIFENDQRKRVYLWIWEKILSKEMDIANDLAGKNFNIDDIEQDHDWVKKYLDYADAVVSVASLAQGTFGNISAANYRPFSYGITNLMGGCSAVTKFYEASGDTTTMKDDALCGTVKSIVNPLNQRNNVFDSVNPILSDFLPKALPKLMEYKKLKLNNLNKIKIPKYGKTDYIALAISIAKIANDSVGAYRASNVNKDLINRLVAREWLSAWFRSGFNKQYMSQIVEKNGNIHLTNRNDQIEVLAKRYGSSGAICDFTEWITIDTVTCKNTEYEVNYDIDEVNKIINDGYMQKSNALYRNITKLIGSFSNEKSEIGTVEINWEDEFIDDEETSPDDTVVTKLDAPKLESSVTIKNGKATLKWNKVENATIYQVYISDKKEVSATNSIASYPSVKTTITIPNIKKGKKYYVAVEAKNISKDLVSFLSNEVEFYEKEADTPTPTPSTPISNQNRISNEYMKNHKTERLASTDCKAKNNKDWKDSKNDLISTLAPADNMMKSIEGCVVVTRLMEYGNLNFDKAVESVVRNRTKETSPFSDVWQDGRDGTSPVPITPSPVPNTSTPAPSTPAPMIDSPFVPMSEDDFYPTTPTPSHSPIPSPIEPPNVKFSGTYWTATGKFVATDQSTSDSGICKWYWEWGDGSTDTIQNPTHYYTESGSYQVALTVTDCSASSNTSSASNSVFQIKLVDAVTDVDTSVDDYPSTHTGETKTLSTSLDGKIETQSDIDAFKIVVEKSGELTLYTTGSLDTLGVLYDSSGTELNRNDDDEDSNFKITYSATAGTYYLDVSAYDTATGSYTVHKQFLGYDDLNDFLDDLFGNDEEDNTVSSNKLTEIYDKWSDNRLIYGNSIVDFAQELGEVYGISVKNQYYDISAFEKVSGIKLSSDDSTDTECQDRSNKCYSSFSQSFLSVNPQILTWMLDNILTPNPKYNKIQEFYNNKGKEFFLPFVYAYKYIHENKDFNSEVNAYNAGINQNKYMAGYLRDKYEGESIDNTTPYHIGFWLRRGLDGSDQAVFYALKKILETYDSNLLNILLNPIENSISDDYSSVHATETTTLSSSSAHSDMLNGKIEREDDIDAFKIIIVDSGTLTLYTTGSLDTIGELYNSDGVLISENDDDGDDYNFKITYPVTRGVYFLNVGGFSRGDYTVHEEFEEEIVISEPIPQTKEWITPSKSVCESNGGEYNQYGYNNCWAKLEDAKRICSSNERVLPTIELLKKVVTDCGGTLEDRDSNKNNSSYQSCFREKGFPANAYWSSTVRYDSFAYPKYINFFEGFEGIYSNSLSLFVRCVRTQ